MTQDRQAIKDALRTKMLSLEAAELETAIEHYERFMADAKLGGREQYDNSDLAEARENRDLAAAFDHPVKDHHSKIDVLENLDFAVTDTVQPGAVVRFGGRSVIVAVSTAQFELEGETYMGISPGSPIYQAMSGLGAGDTFELNGREIKIDEVF
ncbi:hypothetical protein [Aestuariivita boseongensis]|uniref:hypothetical protein n=1 Tax=Aestuariivita boseongensis TaxID=1470562 RepID=UPI000681E588|nr:hypothetical protein [Aestuariivita boseongensis]